MINVYKKIGEKQLKNICEIDVDVDVFMQNPNKFCSEYDKECIVSNDKYEYPMTDDGVNVRNKTREEFILEDGKLDYLLSGEYVEEGEIKITPYDKVYVSPMWGYDNKTWYESANLDYKINEKRVAIRDLNKIRDDISMIEEFGYSKEEMEFLRKEEASKIKEIEKISAEIDILRNND